MKNDRNITINAGMSDKIFEMVMLRSFCISVFSGITVIVTSVNAPMKLMITIQIMMDKRNFGGLIFIDLPFEKIWKNKTI